MSEERIRRYFMVLKHPHIEGWSTEVAQGEWPTPVETSLLRRLEDVVQKAANEMPAWSLIQVIQVAMHASGRYLILFLEGQDGTVQQYREVGDGIAYLLCKVFNENRTMKVRDYPKDLPEAFKSVKPQLIFQYHRQPQQATQQSQPSQPATQMLPDVQAMQSEIVRLRGLLQEKEVAVQRHRQVMEDVLNQQQQVRVVPSLLELGPHDNLQFALKDHSFVEWVRSFFDKEANEQNPFAVAAALLPQMERDYPVRLAKLLFTDDPDHPHNPFTPMGATAAEQQTQHKLWCKWKCYTYMFVRQLMHSAAPSSSRDNIIDLS